MNLSDVSCSGCGRHVDRCRCGVGRYRRHVIPARWRRLGLITLILLVVPGVGAVGDVRSDTIHAAHANPTTTGFAIQDSVDFSCGGRCIGVADSLTVVHLLVSYSLVPTGLAAAQFSVSADVSDNPFPVPCQESGQRASGGGRERVHSHLICPTTGQVVTTETVNVTVSTMTNTVDVSVSITIEQVVYRDTMNVDLAFQGFDNMTVFSVLVLGVIAVLLLVRRWLPTGLSVAGAAVVAFTAGMGLPQADTFFMFALGFALVVGLIEALLTGLWTAKESEGS